METTEGRVKIQTFDISMPGDNRKNIDFDTLTEGLEFQR